MAMPEAGSGFATICPPVVPQLSDKKKAAAEAAAHAGRPACAWDQVLLLRVLG